MRLWLFSLVTVGLLFSGCGSEKKTSENVSSEETTHEIHWGYEGEGAPLFWGDLNPEYAVCKTGTNQSPINVDTTNTQVIAEEEKVNINYSDKTSGTIVNNGHAIQVNPVDGGKITINSVEYDLLQFHFHGHSEHTIDGVQYDMVAHLVHKNSAGELAVIGILFKEGTKDNELINTLWSKIPAQSGEENSLDEININGILPSNIDEYYHYTGSLTTPNCAENVKWYIMKNPLEVSTAQIEKFRTYYSNNYRPIQPLNGRLVEEAK